MSRGVALTAGSERQRAQHSRESSERRRSFTERTEVSSFSLLSVYTHITLLQLIAFLLLSFFPPRVDLIAFPHTLSRNTLAKKISAPLSHSAVFVAHPAAVSRIHILTPASLNVQLAQVPTRTKPWGEVLPLPHPSSRSVGLCSPVEYIGFVQGYVCHAASRHVSELLTAPFLPQDFYF